MIILLVILTIYTLIIYIINIIKTQKLQTNNEFISINKLNTYIFLYTKKRNFANLNHKKQQFYSKNTQKDKEKQVYIKQTYKFIKNTPISNKLNKLITKTKNTYVELKNKNITQELVNLSKKYENQTKFTNIKYRSFNNKECFIETIANTYAHTILLQKNFNLFSSFKNLVKKIKIYKKEAQVLKPLIIFKLIKIYYFLQLDLHHIKKEIIKASKIKKINKINKYSSAFIYGLYKFNPASTKFFKENYEPAIKATNKLLLDLDTIMYNQNIIYSYIKFLSQN